MENCTPISRCLICRRVAIENSSINSEKLVSNATLSQDFLNCFHINVLDSEVNDLSTSCQLCPTCEQFLTEWSSIRTQMTQLTRRAAQLKATLSALLLSAPQIQEQNHDEDVTEIINSRIPNSQLVELPLLLQQTVDDIRNELRKKYSVSLKLEKIPIPSVQKLEPLPVHRDNDVDGETWDRQEFRADDSDEQYSPSDDPLNDEETSEQTLLMRIKTEEEANSDHSSSQESVNFKEMEVKDGSSKTNRGPNDSVQDMSDKMALPPVLKLDPLLVDSDKVNEAWDHWECQANIQLPVVPKIEPLPLSGGHDNDDEPWDHDEFEADDSDGDYFPSEDELNDAEASEQILGLSIETAEEANSEGSNLQDSVVSKKRKVKAGNSKTNECPRKSEVRSVVIPNGPNKFKYHGYDIRLNEEDQHYYCGTCNFRGHTTMTSLLIHIRSLHYTTEDKLNFTAVKTSDTEWLYGGKYKITKIDEKFKCVSCGSAKSCLYKVYRHIRTQHIDSECHDEASPKNVEPDEENLKFEDELINTETSEQILGMRIKTEGEANCDDSNSHESVDSLEIIVKRGSKKTNRGPKRSKKRYANYATIIPVGPNRFKYKGMSFQRNQEDQTYACDSCGFKSSSDIRSIRCHITNHFIKKGKREVKPVVIPVGPNRFKYNGYDIRLNEEDQCYYCGVCNFNCGTKRNTVLGHIRDNHYTVEDKIKFTTVKMSDTEWLYGGTYKIIKVDEKTFKCALCGTEKYRLQRLVLHIRAQHVDMEGTDEVVPLSATDTPSVSNLTPIQGKFQSVPYTFNPADNKFTCGLCQSQVPTRDSLGSHIRQNHSALPKKIPCEFCWKELTHQSYRNHVKRHKTGPMKCPSCYKQFVNEWSFKKHMELHELGEEAKKHKCETCGKRFFTVKNYKDHQRLHTGEKPYECQVCGEKFPGSSYLTRHRSSAHGILPQSRRVVKVKK